MERGGRLYRDICIFMTDLYCWPRTRETRAQQQGGRDRRGLGAGGDLVATATQAAAAPGARQLLGACRTLCHGQYYHAEPIL